MHSNAVAVKVIKDQRNMPFFSSSLWILQKSLYWILLLFFVANWGHSAGCCITRTGMNAGWCCLPTFVPSGGTRPAAGATSHTCKFLLRLVNNHPLLPEVKGHDLNLHTQLLHCHRNNSTTATRMRWCFPGIHSARKSLKCVRSEESSERHFSIKALSFVLESGREE